MLGIDDGWVSLAYVLCLASTALCVVYAWRNWNRGDESPRAEDEQWEAQEEQVEENL